jgi:hypothetical protein
MNRTGLTTTIPLVLLATLATTPILLTQDSFARYQRHTGGDLNQAASITNSCLNPVSNSNTINNMISNGNCGGTVSQQGASIPTTVQNANPTIEVQRSTSTAQPPLTTTGGNCTACFDPLNATQKTELLIALSEGNTIPATTTTIAQLCEFLGGLSSTDLLTVVQTIQSELVSLHHPVNITTSLSIEECLLRTFP